jgi:site-specific recombinase XerD
LAKEQLAQVFAQIHHPMDRALFLLMLRSGLRVSEVAQLQVRDLEWPQQALRIEPGQGRKERRVYLSADAVASLHPGLQPRPRDVPGELVCWNQKRPSRPLAVKAIQKQIQRYANAAGITASCHSLRHTCASNRLEHGAEIVSMREWLGHASISSSERDAKLSHQHVKQAYRRTMQRVLQRSKV